MRGPFLAPALLLLDLIKGGQEGTKPELKEQQVPKGGTLRTRMWRGAMATHTSHLLFLQGLGIGGVSS